MDSSSNNMIDGILFDVDGVLFDSDPLYAVAFQKVFEQCKKKVSTQYLAKLKGRGDLDVINTIRADFNVNEDANDIKDRIHLAYRDIIKGKLVAIDGCLDFVKKAKECNIKMALATSADRKKLFFSLEETGFDYSLFDCIVCGDEVEYAKPHPDVYLKSAAQLGLSNSRCIVFEDSLLGVQAGVAAKSRVIGITTAFSKDLLLQKGAFAVIDSYYDILLFDDKTMLEKNLEAMKNK